jgi:hypothetical protein
MNDIQLRIIELQHRLEVLRNMPKRTQSFLHSETIASVEGEIVGLKWVLLNCFNPSEPNLIEQ